MAYPTNDRQFYEHVLTGVVAHEKGWELRLDEGTCFWCPGDSPIEPRAGMRVRMYGKGFGYTVRGLFIEGERVFYRTEAEDEAKHLADIAATEQEERNEFERERGGLDADYSLLPDVFKRRIDKFRRNNPDFRWKFEKYEMFCCRQALAIAKALKTPEAVRAFAKLDSFEEQRALVPDISNDHSGNTFGCAVKLAYEYLSTPENVVLMHGALAPLVGSEEYGCVAVK